MATYLAMNTLLQSAPLPWANKTLFKIRLNVTNWNATSTTEEERLQRKAAIDFARGSSRFEGVILDPAAEALFARYVNGELTRPELNDAVLKMAGVRPYR